MEVRRPNITVIIPVFNAEKFLGTAVKSAYKQYEVGEIILVEDNSPDNSLELCKKIESEFQDKVKLITHPDRRNHGAGASRNAGIGIARGDYIAFLDADDYYLPNRFSKDMEILINQPEVDGVYNAVDFHVYDPEESLRIKRSLVTLTHNVPPETLFEVMGPIGKAGYFHTNAITVRRNAFELVGEFESSLELSQDTHMWIKMADKLKLVPGDIVNPVATIGVHKNNRIKDKKKLYDFRPIMFESLLNWAIVNKTSTKRKKILLEKLTYHKSRNVRKLYENKTVTNCIKLTFSIIMIHLLILMKYPFLYLQREN